jgi:O-antigen biosynthesis protein
MWLMRRPAGFIPNVLRVLAGTRTWVGYTPGADVHLHLPKLRTGVLHTNDLLPQTQRSEVVSTRLNMLYAKDYKIGNDFTILRRAFRELGR